MIGLTRWVRAVVLGLALVAVAAPAAQAGKTKKIVLGGPWGPYQKGYGKAHPRNIFNGGDPTGVVSNITWKDWGKAVATGTGTGNFVWPGFSVAGGSTQAKATVVAWGRTTCKGKRVYRHLTWYFPEYGDKFHKELAYDLCKKDVYGPYKPTPEVHCDDVTFASGTVATDITGYRMDCATAQTVVAQSAADGYPDGGRFRSGGFFCGSEGYSDLYEAVPYSCALDLVSVSFETS